ncbi:MAG: glutathione S-transferase [Pseudomonadota bacterium]
MPKTPLPILYSFRRCPYAMRARLAILASGLTVELREILLRDKPQAMIEASPKATVPVLVLSDGAVIDESRDIGDWALAQSDPGGWLDGDRSQMKALIDANDGSFKRALDRYKYPNRYPDEHIDAARQRDMAAKIVRGHQGRLASHEWLLGDRATWADYALLPFVRQYAHVDRAWFWAQDWRDVINWLERFLGSTPFEMAMAKHKPWSPGDEPVTFGAPQMPRGVTVTL